MDSHSDLPVTPAKTMIRRAVAGASVGFGFFALITFWWIPYGTILSALGLLMGLISWSIETFGDVEGERHGLTGVIISGIALSGSLACFLARYLSIYGLSVLAP